jgi:hypothetical protein
MTTFMLFTKSKFAFFVRGAVFRLRPFFSRPKKPKKGQATRESATRERGPGRGVDLRRGSDQNRPGDFFLTPTDPDANR